ncbi:MAG: heavy metal translocating P-type ATPase [Patescibacteria group bacterium]|nr:MAG: heavy metal translocating P-type ATPase [Patescibacteria group bacterium]
MTDKSTEIIKKSFPIRGMHCASCVKTIEKALLKTAGVRSASVNFASEVALIEFDEKAVSEAELAEAVSSAGYKLVVESAPSGGKNIEMASLKVVGMDSPHCAMVVGEAIKKLPGIQNADIDFPTCRVKVAFDRSKTDLSQITQVITDAGYHPIKEEGETEDILDREKAERERQVKTLKSKLWVGGILSLIVFLGSFPEWFPFVPGILTNYWILLILATPVQFWVGREFYSGLKLLVKYRTADMNTLIAIGTLAAYFYSAAVTIFPGFFAQGGVAPEIYFDTSAIIIVLILLGKYFEVLMKGRASEAIKKLVGLQPKTAKVLRDGEEVEISIEEVKVGDRLIVRPGEKIPVDGKIVEGESEIDESMVTGESMPVHKGPGEPVIGSTINKFGTFTFEATKVGKDTVLAQIIKLVEEAQGSKAPIQRLADVVSSYFVPVVIVIAILTFIVWYLFGPVPAFSFALVNFVAVLIIACPCALGLATPMAIMVSSGSAATKGILIKDATSLEIANKIDAVILDKTGTLTKGKPQLTNILAFGKGKEADVLALAASLEQGSEHSLAQAILEGAKKEKAKLHKLEGFKAISGKGVRGTLRMGGRKKKAYLGNDTLMVEKGLDLAPYRERIERLEAEGKTVMVLAMDGEVKGAIAVADVLKKEAPAAVEVLQREGVEVWMITGDNQRTAEAIAREVGIKNVMSQVLPDRKAEKVRELQELGKVVAMVGDGINDAPALTQADIGIAMGEGTDVAMESANITLMRGDLRLVSDVIGISRKTMRIIKQNLFWAFFYNSAFIPLAAGALYPFFGILLNPIFAAAAMAFSSVSVVLNSLRLKSVSG